MKLLKCIRIDDFKHHRKLKMGQSYHGVKNTSEFLGGWNIYDLNGNHIGYYHGYQFVEIDEYRDEQIDKILK